MASWSTEVNALRGLFQEKKELFGLVYQFNLMPAAYIHRSWVEQDIPYPLFLNLARSRRGMEKLSKWILKQYNLSRDFYIDFSDPLLRLALLPLKVTMKLVLYCGIALNHNNISAVIDRAKREAITASIGIDGYCFAVKSAPLLMGANETFACTYSEPVDLKTFLEQCGAAYLLSSFVHLPETFLKRMRFKFPRNICQNQELFQQNQTVKYRWQFLRRILLCVIEPQWTKLLS